MRSEPRTLRLEAGEDGEFELTDALDAFLRRELGGAPTVGEIANHLGILPSEVIRIRRAAVESLSLDQPVSEGESTTLGQLVADRHAGTDQFDAAEQISLLLTLLRRLDDRELTVVILRSGVFGERRQTLEEAARRLGISRQRVDSAALQRLQEAATETPLRAA